MSKLFRNSSPGALTREQAVALEKKRAAERRKAAELAEQGRGGDTEIAHVTPGEIVLPHALQTRAVLAAIRQAAIAADIPLERLRIGSRSNSINPETGLPEFDEDQAADESSEPPMEGITVWGHLATDDPYTNKMIQTLHPSVRYDAANFINAVKDRTGQGLRIPDGVGFRTVEQQDKDYAIGRTVPGTTEKDIVTWAPGGKSYHNYGLGFDIRGLNPDGKTLNDRMDYQGIAAIAKEHGFDWGGNWSSHPDQLHFERSYGYTPDELRQMTVPGAVYPTIPGQQSE